MALLRIALILSLFIFLTFTTVITQAANKPSLLLRVDDIGMNHATNMALQDLAETGMPFSASVMVTCPWYQEAVDILKANPQIAVGIHLTLNSEWKYYRWGPVLGSESVPSLVADDGYFWPSTQQFLDHEYDLQEVRQELAAQIDRALSSGLKVAYVDFHMRTALATPELKQVVTDLAREYKVKMSMFLGENYKTMFDTHYNDKKSDFIEHLDTKIDPDEKNLIVIHAARATPENAALVDMNNPTQNSKDGRPLMATHRQSELDMLLSKQIQHQIQKKVKLITYNDF